MNLEYEAKSAAQSGRENVDPAVCSSGAHTNLPHRAVSMSGVPDIDTPLRTVTIAK